MGWLLPHGFICLRSQAGNQHRTATTTAAPPAKLNNLLNLQPKEKIFTEYVTVTWGNFSHFFSFLESFEQPKIKKHNCKCSAQTPWALRCPLTWAFTSCRPAEPPHPILPSFSHSHTVCASLEASQLLHSSPGEIIFSSRRWFVWSQRRLHDRCFSGCETPPVPLSASPPPPNPRPQKVWRYVDLKRKKRFVSLCRVCVKHLQMLAVSSWSC